MHKLTITNNGQYRNKKGTLVFRYVVKGSESALKAYEEAQGEFYTEDSTTGKPLYFSARFVGRQCDLIVTDEGKVYPDMSELEQQASLVAQFGGNLGQAMADEMARRLTGRGASLSTKSTESEESTTDDEGTPLDADKPKVTRLKRK